MGVRAVEVAEPVGRYIHICTRIHGDACGIRNRLYRYPLQRRSNGTCSRKCLRNGGTARCNGTVLFE